MFQIEKSLSENTQALITRSNVASCNNHPAMRNANTALNTLPIGDQTIIKLLTQMDPAQKCMGPYNYRYPFTPPAVKPPTRNF